MRKSFVPFVLLGLVAGPLPASAPVHIALKASAMVSPDADGFFTLGAVADLSGGDAAERGRFRDVRVGRAPLPDQVRQVTSGDVLLKLRQAGYHPEMDAVLGGAPKIAVTVAGSGPDGGPQTVPSGGDTPAHSPHPPAPAPAVIRRGDAVTILIQDGDMAISAKGIARDAGAAGDSIHVHRDGVLADLVVTVQDAQTVRLEL